MMRLLSGMLAAGAWLCLAGTANGQQMTERYIPVGQSPGVSGVYSYIGEITAVDQANRTITVQGPQGERTIKVLDETRIWLDRSQQRQTSLVGSMSDLRPGRRVEVKYVDYETKEAASWIKVAVTGGG